MKNLSVAQILRDLDSGQYSSRELTQYYIDRIEANNSKLNAYVTCDFSHALEKADIQDELRNKGEASALSGLPIAHKDIFCTEGLRTTAGSKMLGEFVPPYTATVVSNFDEHGAILLGKTNMDEFAMGSSNENSFYGATLNPWDTSRIPGGSSGGSAAAVAADLCAAATGTDTGGSIRQPAAMCGITGVKPTYGRASRWGMIAYASSLDQAGPMTRSAEDAAILLEAMCGHDAKDSTSIPQDPPKLVESLNNPIKGLRIGICKEYLSNELNPSIAENVLASVEILKSQGAIISEVSLPNVQHAIPAYYIIAPAEASANLSRFDGVRFGYRCDEPKDLNDLYTRSRSEGFGAEVKNRIMIGSFALSAGYYDAYYGKAQQIRRLIKNDFMTAFNQVDLIVGPISPSPAFKIGEKTSNPTDMYLQDIFTVTANLVGLPAASIPSGFVDGLPVGLQLIGNHFDEATLLKAAHSFQQATDFHKQFAEVS